MNLKDWTNGFLCGLAGKGRVVGSPEPIAYLYNGVQLPALPEWDRESYPYAMIIYYPANNYCILDVTTTEGWCNPSYTGVFGNDDPRLAILFPDDTLFCTYYDYYDKTPGYFGLVNEAITFTARITDEYCYVLWANYDIPNEDGTVYLAASDPVPVYE